MNTSRDIDRHHERLRAQGLRIDALRAVVAMPGAAARSGFSTRIAALRDRHRSTSADLARLAKTPETDEDWKKLHDRLDEALAQMDHELGRTEADVTTS